MSISAEIAGLIPIFESGIYGGQWPFLEDGRFGSTDGLAKLRIAEPENLEVIEALGSLL